MRNTQGFQQSLGRRRDETAWIRIFPEAIILSGSLIRVERLRRWGSDAAASPRPVFTANLTADAGDNQVVLNWPSAAAPPPTLYYDNVAGVTKSAPHKITGSVSAPKTVTGLTNGTPYFFAVRR